jgi:hypothetical protein
MVLYKLVSEFGSTLARSSQRSYLVSLQESYPGSRIVKESPRAIDTTQETTLARTTTRKPSTKTRRKQPRKPKKRKSAPPPKARGRISIIPSSWIRDHKYDVLTGELHINMRGKWYGPWFIDPNTYLKFVTGKAVPTTTDTQRPARWGMGIGPSMGAAYHQYIKIGGGLAPGQLTIEEQLLRKQRLLAAIT